MDFVHCGERIDGDRHSQIRWRFVRGHDEPRLMGVGIDLLSSQNPSLEMYVNSNQNPGYLLYIRDYTTQLYWDSTTQYNGS